MPPSPNGDNINTGKVQIRFIQKFMQISNTPLADLILFSETKNRSIIIMIKIKTFFVKYSLPKYKKWNPFVQKRPNLSFF